MQSRIRWRRFEVGRAYSVRFDHCRSYRAYDNTYQPYDGA
nr:BA14K family protein [Sinorhizobium sp. 7-81]